MLLCLNTIEGLINQSSDIYGSGVFQIHLSVNASACQNDGIKFNIFLEIQIKFKAKDS